MRLKYFHTNTRLHVYFSCFSFFFFFFYRTLHSAVLLILIMHVDWTPRTAESHFISFFLSVHFFASRSPSANPFLVVERNNSKYFCRMKSGTQIHYTDKTFQTNARWFPIIIQSENLFPTFVTRVRTFVITSYTVALYEGTCYVLD